MLLTFRDLFSSETYGFFRAYRKRRTELLEICLCDRWDARHQGGAVRACRYGRGCRHACADSGVHNRTQRLRARVSLLDVRLCGHLFDKGQQRGGDSRRIFGAAAQSGDAERIIG